VDIEPRGTQLSRQRAGEVADYLIDIWKIDSSRIDIRARNLPENPSYPDDPDGAEENRRVEISASDAEILAPVVTSDTLRQTDPPVIRFYIDIDNPDASSEWTLTATQSGRLLKRFSGNGAPPEKIEWQVNAEKNTIPIGEEPVEYRLVIAAKNGRQVGTEGKELPHRVKTLCLKRIEQMDDKKIDRYSLILFGFDEYRLNVTNRELAEWIATRIENNSTVRVTGFTDRIGEEEYNLMLSRRRAAETARIFATGNEQTAGKGESAELFDNDLPEGRFYSRTVNIIIETPIEW
jgi:outer membrane protein OmpA-like peptidoglycan-associated protein